jgi:GGDEF domain-containing protein
MEQDQGQDQGQGQAPGEYSLGDLYGEASRRGWFKEPGDLQQMAHELRARGLIVDPTQGGLVNPNAPPPAAPAPPVNPNAPAPYMQVPPRVAAHPAGAPPVLPPVPPGFSAPAPVTPQPRPVHGSFDARFNTILSPADERHFQTWKQQYAPHDSGDDYDLRGAFSAGLRPNAQTGHWPDRFKKPNHPTFSNESQYALYGRPGHWQGETFIPPSRLAQAPVQRPPQFLQDVAPSGKRRIAPIGFIKSPDETTIKQQNAELDQIGKQFGPGHHYAEGGPVDLKKRAAAETTAQLGGSLPALWQDWTTRARALRQAEDQTIAAIKRWSQGKLSPADAAQARQDWHDLEQNRQILMARAERLRAYAGMAGQTARQYNGQAIHNGPLLPQEAPGRQGSGAWDIAKGTVAGTVGSIAGPAFQKFEGTPVGGWLVRNIEGLKPGVIDAYTQALPQARQQVMLEGKYPALPANPGKNPAEQAALDEQTKQLRRMFFTDVPGIGLMPSGAVGSAAWRQQIHQMPLTPWQQKLVPIFESQVAAEREASERAKLGQSALTDAASFALAEFGGKLIGKPVAKFLGRFAEPLEQRLMASGAPILVKNAAKFGLRAGVNTLSHGAGAAATGAVAGALLAAEDLQQQAAGGRGSSPADYARAAGQGAANIGGIGAVMGAAGHLLHPRATVHAAPSEAYHTALPAPKIKPDLIDLPDGRQVDLNHTTRSELETINNFLPGDHPARAKIEQKLWGPKSEPVGAAKVADPHGAAVSARSLTPEEITNVLQDFTTAEQQAPLTPEQQQNKTAVEAQATAIEAHKEAQNLPVPPEAQGDEQAAFTKSKVLGQTHYNAVKGVAESVRAENPDLAAKLDTAAARMRAESRADFREDYHVASGAYPERATAVPPPQHSTWRDLTDAERATLPENIRRILLIQDARNSGQVLHPELAAREFTKGYEKRATAWLARTADDLYHSAEAKYGDGKPQAIAAPPAPAGAAVPTAGVAPAAPTIGITPPAGQVEAAGTATPRPGSAFGGPAPAWEVGRERPIEPARPGEAPDANAPFPLNVRGEGVSPHETPLEQAARFVVDTGKTTEFDLQRKFNLSFEDAEDLLHGLRERGVIGNKGEGGLSPVIARREQLDGLFAADRRRRAVEMAGGQPIAYPPALAEPAKRTLIEPAPKPERPTGPLDHVAPGEFGAPATEGRIERGGGPRRVDLGDLRTEAQRAAGGEGQPVGRMLTNKEKGARLIPKGEGGPERIPVPEAGAESKPAYPGPERRVNPAERKLVEEMTPEEKDRALLHDEMSGLGNTRAWNETAPRGTRKAHVADIDADGLGAINKHYGEVGGDALIGAVGDALRKAGLGDNAFRRGGDEFRAHADSPEDLQRRLDAARQILEETAISFTDNNGETRTLKGASLSYGIAETETKANIALKADKAGRRKLGLRAKRKESLPPRLVEVGRGGGPVSERNAAPVRARAGRASEGNPEGARPGVAAPKKKIGLKKQASEAQAHPLHPEVALKEQQQKPQQKPQPQRATKEATKNPAPKPPAAAKPQPEVPQSFLTPERAETLVGRYATAPEESATAKVTLAELRRHRADITLPQIGSKVELDSAEVVAGGPLDGYVTKVVRPGVRTRDGVLVHAQVETAAQAPRVGLKEQQQKPQLAPDVLAKRQALQREQEAAARAKQGAPRAADLAFPHRLYHGTRAQFEGLPEPSTAQQWGKAVYFATDPRLPREEYGHSGRVLEYYGDFQKPLHVPSPEYDRIVRDLNRESDARYDGLMERADNGDRAAERELDRFAAFDSSEPEGGAAIAERARREGYDAIINPHEEFGHEVAVLDTARLRTPEEMASRLPGEDVFGRPQVLPADTPASEQSDFQAFGASYSPEVVDRLPAMPQGEGWHAMQHQQQLVGPPPGPSVPPPTPNPHRSFGPPQGEVSKAVQNLPIDPEVKGQFLARHGDPNARSPELWSAIREKFAGIGDGLKQIHQEMVRVFPDLPNDQQHTELIQKFLRRQAGDAIAYSRVHRDIHQALHGLSHGERQILELQRYVNDMVATAAKQRDTWVKSGKDPAQFKSLLPDGLTEAQAAQAKQQIEAYLKQGATADGIDAAKIAAAHDKIVDYRKKVVDRFVDLYQQVNGVKLDLDPDTYFRHNLLYLAAAEETLGTGGGKGIHTRASRSWLKSRTGSELPYNTNFVESELSWVPEMIKDTLDLEILHHVQQTYDLSPSVKLAQAELGNKGMIDFMQAIDGGKTPAADQVPALMKLAAEGRLPDRLNGEFRPLLDSLSYLHRKNLELKARGKPLHGLSPEMTTALKSYAGFMLDQDKHGQVKIRSIVEDPRWLARNGYKEYQAREGRHFFRAMSVPERLMNDAAGAVLNQIVLGKEDLRSVLAVGAARRKMILPAHVADALERFGAPGSDYQTRLQKGARWLQAAWKWDKLYNPVHAPIYWTNNLKSDMVAIARGNPRALTYIPKAAVEVARALRGKTISPELNRWIDKGGLASTFIRREGLGEGAGVDLLRKYYTHQEPRWVRVKQAYKNVMELPHEWREATGRYATYLAFLDDLKTNGGMPKRYGASIPALVDGLSDLHDKAWKLSNDLVGAYNEVSPVGQNLRRFVFPFWSWQEVSFKREMRLLRNAINSPEVARGMGKQLNGVQATGVRLLALSRYLAGAAMVGAAAEGWNRMWYGADYRKKLPKELRESFAPVWILRNDPKSGQLLYHRFPGDFVETLDWLGINGGYHYLQDYMNRKMTGWEIAQDFAGDSARALANHVYQQSSFAFKAEQELIGGQTGFPDATDPRRVDKLEAFFREASLDKSYRMLRGIPLPKPAKVKLFGKEIGGRLPLKAGPWLAGMDVIHTLLNVSAANVEENNYFDVKADAGQWKRQKNGGGGTPAADRDAKASAAYYFRLSMRYGDIDSAERFLWDFHRYGGTDQAMQQSLQDMEPLHGLKLSEQSRFLEQADGEEKERVRRAYLHWANLVAPEYDASWFSKAALDSQAIMQIRAQVGGALKATWAQRTDAGMSLDPVIAKIQGLTPADRSTYLGRMNGDGAAKVRERYRVLAGRAAPGVKPPPDSMPLPEWVERLQAAIAQATGTQAQEQIQEQGYRGQ